MKLAQWLKLARPRLEGARLGCADAVLHARQLAELALGFSAAQVYSRIDDDLSASEIQKLEAVIERRLTGEPFQYIAGEEGFWNSQFRVGRGVLIPRRETEHLVEALLARATQPDVKVAELGAGSGNIGISVLQERPTWEWHTFELNPDSRPFVEENRRRLLPAAARYILHFGDFFATASQNAPYDFIVSNPPYIASSGMEDLPPEVKCEPRLALESGEQGLDCIARLLKGSEWLRPGGAILLEIGSDQESSASALASEAGLERVEVLRDYAGLPRVLCAYRGN